MTDEALDKIEVVHADADLRVGTGEEFRQDTGARLAPSLSIMEELLRSRDEGWIIMIVLIPEPILVLISCIRMFDEDVGHAKVLVHVEFDIIIEHICLSRAIVHVQIFAVHICCHHTPNSVSQGRCWEMGRKQKITLRRLAYAVRVSKPCAVVIDWPICLEWYRRVVVERVIIACRDPSAEQAFSGPLTNIVERSTNIVERSTNIVERSTNIVRRSILARTLSFRVL